MHELRELEVKRRLSASGQAHQKRQEKAAALPALHDPLELPRAPWWRGWRPKSGHATIEQSKRLAKR